MTLLRNDIQALRGFAVLLVLFYHAKLGFASGYLGVDIFFVISGFLITGLVKRAIERGEFSFKEFYVRRAKRLLPAAYVTILVTVVVSPFMLVSAELADVKLQALGAIAFISNIILYSQSGYFAGAAEFKPLLHMWSLSVEEQYYFLLPALLVFVPRKWWKVGCVLAVLTSFWLCWYVSLRSPSAAFYFLPTRAWEMGLGSIGALFVGSRWLQNVVRALFWPALLMMLVLPLLAPSRSHPGIDALIICVATVFVIMRQHFLGTSRSLRLVSKIGDMSYSLYLVHWPIFAFVGNAWLGEVESTFPLTLKISLVAASFALAFLLHRFVEVPARNMTVENIKPFAAKVLAASLSLVAVIFGAAHATSSSIDYVESSRANMGLGAECAFDERFAPSAKCSTTENPTVLVWGDSFAMHVIPALLATPNAGIVQATKSSCGPTLGAAMIYGKGYRSDWPQRCIDFNDSVLDYLKGHENIQLVVLSSALGMYLSPDKKILVRDQSENFKFVKAETEAVLQGLSSTVEEIHKLGRRVVLIAPPPAGGFDSARCLERASKGLPLFGIDQTCQISVSAYNRTMGDIRTLVDTLESQYSVPIIRFDQILCGGNACLTSLDGIAVYRDGAHLSYAGSRALGEKMQLMTTVKRVAN